MNKEEFKNNLINCITKLGFTDAQDLRFKIVPVIERGKNLNSTDDYTKLNIVHFKKSVGIKKMPNNLYVS